MPKKAKPTRRRLEARSHLAMGRYSGTPRAPSGCSSSNLAGSRTSTSTALRKGCAAAGAALDAAWGRGQAAGTGGSSRGGGGGVRLNRAAAAASTRLRSPAAPALGIGLLWRDALDARRRQLLVHVAPVDGLLERRLEARQHDEGAQEAGLRCGGGGGGGTGQAGRSARARASACWPGRLLAWAPAASPLEPARGRGAAGALRANASLALSLPRTAARPRPMYTPCSVALAPSAIAGSGRAATRSCRARCAALRATGSAAGRCAGAAAARCDAAWCSIARPRQRLGVVVVVVVVVWWWWWCVGSARGRWRGAGQRWGTLAGRWAHSAAVS
jgi:hypothetical protein